jgi:hypothetical protein
MSRIMCGSSHIGDSTRHDCGGRFALPANKANRTATHARGNRIGRASQSQPPFRPTAQVSSRSWRTSPSRARPKISSAAPSEWNSLAAKPASPTRPFRRPSAAPSQYRIRTAIARPPPQATNRPCAERWSGTPGACPDPKEVFWPHALRRESFAAEHEPGSGQADTSAARRRVRTIPAALRPRTGPAGRVVPWAEGVPPVAVES